jgi:hypothetical protein
MTELNSLTKFSSTFSKLRRGSTSLENGVKPCKGRGSVTLPALGPNLSELQQLAIECGVDVSIIWQSALAVALHYYNPSEAVSFACQDELLRNGLEKFEKISICTLRIEPAETIFNLLQRFHGSKNSNHEQSFDHKISWTQVEDGRINDGACKVVIRCHSRTGKRCFSDIDQTVCIHFTRING